MALIREFVCITCGSTVMEVTDYSNVCGQCRTNEANARKRMHLASLKGLTVEERLARIEEELYDSNANKRLRALESKNATY